MKGNEEKIGVIARDMGRRREAKHKALENKAFI